MVSRPARSVVVNVISNLATNTFNIREDNSVNTSNTIGVAGSYPAATIIEDPTTFVNLSQLTMVPTVILSMLMSSAMVQPPSPRGAASRE